MIDARELPWGVNSGAADCTARDSRPGSPVSAPPCGGRAAVAVDLRYSYDKSETTVFLCERHGAEVPASRPMTAAEVVESDRRRVDEAYWRSVIEKNRQRTYGH